MVRWFRVAVAVCLLIATANTGTAHADPNALWTIVHDQCVPDQQTSGDPAPCALVDVSAGPRGGYAVLKDIVGATQFLVIPTDRISGIESPELLDPGVANYFAMAWQARTFVTERAGVMLPRDWISLALNSADGRSQNQFHIHVDCVRVDVRESLLRFAADVGPVWAPFPHPLAGHPYLAMAIEGEDLGAINPIQLLAGQVPAARDNMGRQTVVVLGAYLRDGLPGFILLAGSADPAVGNVGSGEELQDHAVCPPPRGQWVK
jgi:CDP-diacylglycerol pyrophosphatase